MYAVLKFRSNLDVDSDNIFWKIKYTCNHSAWLCSKTPTNNCKGGAIDTITEYPHCSTTVIIEDISKAMQRKQENKAVNQFDCIDFSKLLIVEPDLEWTCNQNRILYEIRIHNRTQMPFCSSVLRSDCSNIPVWWMLRLIEFIQFGDTE